MTLELKRLRKSGRRMNALRGQKFGGLTVVALNYRDPKRNSWWECECECGNSTVVRADNLKNENTTSCGCYRRERLARANSKRAAPGVSPPKQLIQSGGESSNHLRIDPSPEDCCDSEGVSTEKARTAWPY